MYSKNIVCFSLNAPPLNNAEAFCTARFISALTQQDINVHLITIDHPQQLDKSIVDELLDKKIIITRLTLPKQSMFKSAINKIKHLFFAEFSEYTDFFVTEVKTILQSYEKPILLTRGWPPASNIIGCYLSKYYSKWIAHFGDPYPGLGIYSRRTIIYKLFDLRWAKRIFKRADLVTVTSRNAIKHFNNTLNKDYSKKIEVAYHIGYPALTYPEQVNLFDQNCFNFTHVGFWSYIRYMKEIITEFNMGYAEWPSFKLVQFGKIEENNSYIKDINKYPWISIKGNANASPRDSSYILANAYMNIIVDQNDGLEYCPYLASKFVYAIWSGRPVIGIGQEDSEMSKLSKEYPSFYFVNIRKPNELYNLILSLKDKNESEILFPDKKIKELFTPESVASKFRDRINNL